MRMYRKKKYFCFLAEAKAFDCVDHNQLWKILKEMGILDHLPCLLSNVYAGQETSLELDMEHRWVPLKKEYVKALYFHLDYLTFIQSTSCEMLGWIKHSWNQECQEI